jgi:hypothetical protein
MRAFIEYRTTCWSRSLKRRLNSNDGADAAAPSGLRIAIRFLKRLQRTVALASTLARPSAADPQPRYVSN